MILDTTTSNTSRHVKRETYPADLGTRRLTITQTLESTWLNAPTWIQNEDEWPKNMKIKNFEVEKETQIIEYNS